MSAWDIINALLRLSLTILCIYKLAQFREQANLCERTGIGMMGGGSFMTIGIIVEGPMSPFDGWATTVLTMGIVLLVAGRTWRDLQHDRNNRRQLAISQSWMKGRGE